MVDIETIALGIMFVFIGIIAFMVGTTLLQSTMPIMNSVAGNSTFMNYTDYSTKRDMIWTAANIGMYIIVGAVFLYLAARLLYRREPVTDVYGPS